MQFTRSGSFLSKIEQVLAPVVVPALPDLDDEPREVELEVSDQVPPAPLRLAEPTPRHEPNVAPAGTIRDLFSQIEIRPGPGGRVTFDAPAEAAAALSAMFEGMAKMLSPRG